DSYDLKQLHLLMQDIFKLNLNLIPSYVSSILKNNLDVREIEELKESIKVLKNPEFEECLSYFDNLTKAGRGSLVYKLTKDLTDPELSNSSKEILKSLFEISSDSEVWKEINSRDIPADVSQKILNGFYLEKNFGESQVSLDKIIKTAEQIKTLRKDLEKNPNNCINQNLLKEREKILDEFVLNAQTDAVKYALGIEKIQSLQEILCRENYSDENVPSSKKEKNKSALFKRLEEDEDLTNALQLYQSLKKEGVSRNISTLRRVIRYCFENQPNKIYEESPNKRELEALTSKGINFDVWMKGIASKEDYKRKDTEIQVYLETNPLKILQMGNVVNGSCLRLGAGQEESVIPNAAEVNKRVLYVKDRTGRIVGRKLLALDPEGILLLYRPYFNLDKTFLSKERVISAIDEYVSRFSEEIGAKRMNPEDSCDKTPNSIFGGYWYDDGIV
ncbi:MAG TPA: hypothetical protein PLK34_02840, partial [Candidatus Pacearchaeota archaeon]|nr:hypothetical protein [Candidatus Pacearchaeota archaeon]